MLGIHWWCLSLLEKWCISDPSQRGRPLRRRKDAPVTRQVDFSRLSDPAGAERLRPRRPLHGRYPDQVVSRWAGVHGRWRKWWRPAAGPHSGRWCTWECNVSSEGMQRGLFNSCNIIRAVQWELQSCCFSNVRNQIQTWCGLMSREVVGFKTPTVPNGLEGAEAGPDRRPGPTCWCCCKTHQGYIQVSHTLIQSHKVFSCAANFDRIYRFSNILCFYWHFVMVLQYGKCRCLLYVTSNRSLWVSTISCASIEVIKYLFNQRGYVFICIRRITQQLLNRLPQNLVGGFGIGQERKHLILVQIWIIAWS